MLYQEQFILLKCFMDYGTIPGDQVIDYWIKILDPSTLRRIDRVEMHDFLELLARGNTNEEQTLISKQYAKNLLILLDLEGCIWHNEFMTTTKEKTSPRNSPRLPVIGYEHPYGKPGDMVMMDRLEECLRSGVIGVDVLN
jgi:hypothetical protein